MTVSPLSSKSTHYRKRWNLDRVSGAPSRMVPAAPVRRHLEQLSAAGVTQYAIAEAAAVSKTALRNILDGQATVRRGVAARLLAADLRVAMRRTSGAAWVPSIGSQRRIRALLAMGWRHQDLNRWLLEHGVRHRSNLVLSKPGDLLAARTAAAVSAMYDELWDVKGPSERTSARASRRGYAPPQAWDDDTIDDPAAKPLGLEGVMASTRAALIEDVEELVAQGAMVAEATARLGKNKGNLERTLQRAGRHDLWARLQGNRPASTAPQAVPA